jgi:hypothetical protein
MLAVAEEVEDNLEVVQEDKVAEDLVADLEDQVVKEQQIEVAVVEELDTILLQTQELVVVKV